MKTLINSIKIFKLMRTSPHIFKVVEDIFKFAELTHKEQRPMATKIVLLNMKDGTKYSDFVSLWAGIGEANPIDRAGHLKAQNTELKRLLTLSLNKNITKDDIELIETTLRIFE
ncbi:MAG: hypothetical protein AABY22_26930 [Nanoarchaeota archaeon]